MGTSVYQLIREYLERLAGKTDPNAHAEEFEKLSRLAQGDSRGWRFNREELHERPCAAQSRVADAWTGRPL